ncbi:MAG: hypothetical protein VKJ86_05140 [Synechococcus sp.]|nr:hypothetical protein [Synechococcus sp.]
MMNRPGQISPTHYPWQFVYRQLVEILWQHPHCGGVYGVHCAYQAQEQAFLDNLVGDRRLKQVWYQRFSQGTGAYYGASALGDLAQTKTAEGLLCLWLAPDTKNIGEILCWVGDALATPVVTPTHIQGIFIFGLTNPIELETPLFFQNAPLTLPLVFFYPSALPKPSIFGQKSIDLGVITGSEQDIQGWWHKTEQDYFQALVTAGPFIFSRNETFNLAPSQRVYQDLRAAAALVEEAAEFQRFLEGRQAHQQQNLAIAQAAYLDSLQSYGHSGGIDWLKVLRDNPNSPLLDQLPPAQAQRLALVLFHLGLLLGDRPENFPQPTPDGEQALQYLRWSLRLWEHQQQWPWVSELSLIVGAFLQQWQRWPALEDLAWSLLQPTQDPWGPTLIAQNYGLMAAIALQKKQRHKAQTLAETALVALQGPDTISPPGAIAWVSLIAAQAAQALGQSQKAIALLEDTLPMLRQSLNTPTSWCHWQRLVAQRIFHSLSQLYRQGKDDRQAFDLTWELQQYEQQWDWHPFVGTQPLPDSQEGNPTHLSRLVMEASGRQTDIQALLEKLQQPQPNLILLHGAAAAGKTSLLRRGLIPLLQRTNLHGRSVQTIYLKTYGQWARRLIESIHGDRPFCPRITPPSADPLVHLQQEQDAQPQRVLIFDQFEQFFQQYPRPEERQDFLKFLAQSLHLPTVNVILSFRNEALAPLLDWENSADLGPGNRNIFDQRIRHRLGNLQAEAALSLFAQVAHRFDLPWEESLGDHLVQDLRDDHGEIRPRDLQVIGAQLQRDRLYTLDAYLSLGFPPPLVLLERSLMNIVRLCGDENRDLAWQFLHYFTDLRHSQLVLTKADILQLGRQVLGDRRLGEVKAELILHIFKTTGLIRYQFYAGQESYQLARADLLEPIRHHYQTFQSQQRFRQLSTRKQVIQWRRWWQLSVGTIWRLGLGAIALGFGIHWAELQRYQRWQETENAALAKLTEAANVLQTGAEPTEALRESIRAAVQLQRLDRKDDDLITPATRLKVILTLEQNLGAQQASLQTMRDFAQNLIPVMFRPPGDRQRINPDEPITDFSFVGTRFQVLMTHPNHPLQWWPNQGETPAVLRENPDILKLAWQPRGNLWAAGDAVGLVEVRQTSGQAVRTLGGFRNKITALAWSRDGELLAAGSADQTIRVWSATGELLQILTEHRGPITAVQFSPDGKLLATAAGDRTVQIWQRRRNNSFFLVTQFPPFPGAITDIQFSADSRYLGLTDTDQQVVVLPMTYKNNNPQFGEPVTINHQSKGASRISFYGKLPLLLTNTDNHHLQFWQLDGTFLGSLVGHQAPVQELRWHPQRKAIATVDQNNQLILWNLDLDELVQRSCRLLVYGNLSIPAAQHPGDRQLCAVPLNLPPE